jgi:hypothetical protein
MLAVHPAAAQEHRFEADPVVSLRMNYRTSSSTWPVK